MRPRTRPRTSRASRGFAPPLLALLALLALSRAPSASADVAGGASGSLGASEARGAARATPLRVGDAGARVARVTATPGEPFASAQAVEVRGFSRLTQPHKAFHHVTLEVFDDARSSFARNECELRLADGRRVKSARRGPGWPRKRDAVLKFAKANFVANEKLSVADDRAANDRATRTTRSAPTLVADFGPFDATRVVVSCGVSSPSSGFDRHDTNVHVRVDDAFTVTFEIFGNDRDVTTRRWRFILGTALAMFAPRLADVAAAYYVSGAILGVAALALFFAAKAARIVPGGRAARTGAGVVAAVSAFVVPPEHVTKVLEMYVSLWLAPARLVVAAARRALFGGSSRFLDLDGARTEYAGDPNVSDEGALEAVTLAYALAGTALTLAGAGAGLWATNAWVIDKSTGEVAAPAAAFARVAARALGATLLQFCTADAALGGALASIALVSAVAESAKSGSLARALSFFTRTKKKRRVSRGDARRESDSDRSRRSDWSDSDDEDEEERARGRFETNTTPRSRGSARGRSAQFSGSASGLRRRGRERARSRDAESSDEEDAPSPGWNWFGGASRSRRGRRRRRGDGGYGTPTTLDPEPRTPPVVLVGTGAGALGASPGRTPGAGLRPWLDSLSLRGGSASPFSFGFFSRSPRAASASRDSDSEDDADGDALLRERHRAAAAAAAGARRAAGRSGRSGHVTRTHTAEANPVPVGMAARARGRFMTRAEYDAQGAERTDRGLDELCGTPEFAKWMAKQSHRVRLVATDLDSDEDR